tara:strand:- start:409 stop:510 length:102 start_codon:yes stop_codon:yes gene_type:complete
MSFNMEGYWSLTKSELKELIFELEKLLEMKKNE